MKRSKIVQKRDLFFREILCDGFGEILIKYENYGKNYEKN